MIKFVLTIALTFISSAAQAEQSTSTALHTDSWTTFERLSQALTKYNNETDSGTREQLLKILPNLLYAHAARVEQLIGAYDPVFPVIADYEIFRLQQLTPQASAILLSTLDETLIKMKKGECDVLSRTFLSNCSKPDAKAIEYILLSWKQMLQVMNCQRLLLPQN